MLLSLLVLVSLASSHASKYDEYTPGALADQITNLPGAEGLDVPFKQFSGYLDVGDTKHLHYWFVESQNDPQTDPIAFWTVYTINTLYTPYYDIFKYKR